LIAAIEAAAIDVGLEIADFKFDARVKQVPELERELVSDGAAEIDVGVV